MAFEPFLILDEQRRVVMAKKSHMVKIHSGGKKKSRKRRGAKKGAKKRRVKK